ncbi:MAG TPA: alpha/beta hydrolase [Gammaproteobacteria bacterium]|nr:alpha/beta hydrolase [Gammaproteobacteria bacterium]
MIQIIYRFVLLVAVWISLCVTATAQELIPISEYPGIETLGERKVPAPVGVSPEMLKIVVSRQIPPFVPAPTSEEDWLKLQAIFDVPGGEVGLASAERLGVTYEVKEIAGVRCYVVTPKEIGDRFADVFFVHIHGGAFVFGGGDSALREAVWAAAGLKVRVISVDYRRPPLHPFPAAVDDTVAVWRALIKDQDPAATALFGTSAGGNIVLASTLKLKQLGLPLPGALFAGTPATDLANKTDTWYTLEGLDPLGSREGLIQGAMDLYAGETDISDPLVSPVNADVTGFPPTILFSGTRDLLLSDTVRMHRSLRAAGVPADLHIYDAQTHGDYLQGLTQFLPESDDALLELQDFFDEHLK